MLPLLYMLKPTQQLALSSNEMYSKMKISKQYISFFARSAGLNILETSKEKKWLKRGKAREERKKKKCACMHTHTYVLSSISGLIEKKLSQIMHLLSEVVTTQ